MAHPLWGQGQGQGADGEQPGGPIHCCSELSEPHLHTEDTDAPPCFGGPGWLPSNNAHCSFHTHSSL